MEKLRILVTDDEPGMRMAVVRSLRDFRLHLGDIGEEVTFETDTAGSGEEALEKIHRQAPDILLLDHKLPGLSGLDVLEHLTAEPPQTPVLTVMVTAYASLETAVSAIKKGAFDFLAKPFTPAELKAAVSKTAESLMTSRQARRLAQEKRQLRFQFISVLAHELKSPLNAVEGYLRIMLDQPEAVKSKEMLDGMIGRCLTRTEQMRKLIVDLLEITRIESGQKRRDLVEVNLEEIAHRAIETALPEALKREITLQLQPVPEVHLRADREEIEIILNNLISNAVKYNRDGGKVGVDISLAADGKVLIAVSDTGIGMSAEEVALLFNEFVRIKNDKTRGILGSGLGLSIIKKLAAFYGGECSVESTPGQGSTFSVSLDPSYRMDGVEHGTPGHNPLVAGRPS